MCELSDVLVAIPARQHSTRLENKMLLAGTGLPLIVHTYLSAKKKFPNVIVATDSYDIAHVVTQYGGKSILTSPTCESGTERIASILYATPAKYIINWQGDEPELDPDSVLRALLLLRSDEDAQISTLASKITNIDDLYNPNCVKVQFGRHSREAVSFTREPSPWIDFNTASRRLSELQYWKHIGLYVFKRDCLSNYNNLPIGRSIENKLEQLKALDSGIKIIVETCDHAFNSIDTAADYSKFEQRR